MRSQSGSKCLTPRLRKPLAWSMTAVSGFDGISWRKAAGEQRSAVGLAPRAEICWRGRAGCGQGSDVHGAGVKDCPGRKKSLSRSAIGRLRTLFPLGTKVREAGPAPWHGSISEIDAQGSSSRRQVLPSRRFLACISAALWQLGNMDTFSFTLHSWGQSGLTPPARCVSTVGQER